MTKFFDAPYLLVIETNRYSGNFERQLTAYSIGSIGECGVGDNEARRFAQEEPEFFIKQTITVEQELLSTYP